MLLASGDFDDLLQIPSNARGATMLHFRLQFFLRISHIAALGHDTISRRRGGLEVLDLVIGNDQEIVFRVDMPENFGRGLAPDLDVFPTGNGDDCIDDHMNARPDLVGATMPS